MGCPCLNISLHWILTKNCFKKKICQNISSQSKIIVFLDCTRILYLTRKLSDQCIYNLSSKDDTFSKNPNTSIRNIEV